MSTDQLKLVVYVLLTAIAMIGLAVGAWEVVPLMGLAAWITWRAA